MKITKNEEWPLYFIKYFTYIIASVLMLTVKENAALIMPLTTALILLFANAIIRDRLYYSERLYNYGMVSAVLEAIIILSISLIENSGVTVLFYMVCLSEATISFDLKFSGTLTVLIFLTITAVNAFEWAYVNIYSVIINSVLSFGAAIAFTFIMSYVVKLQMQEKERIKKANEELEGAYRKLLISSSKVQQLTVEKERNRMAREIHDTLAHTLTALVVQLEAGKKLLGVDADQARLELDKAQELTRSGLNEVRRSVKALRPEALEKHEFFDALDNLINEFAEYSNAKIVYEKQIDDDIRLTEQQEIALYRIIQESITNSVRHGKAEKINVTIKCENGFLNIDISDNGSGCSHIKKGHGLRGIAERAEALKGTASFCSMNGGFWTKVNIPYSGGPRDGN